MMLSIVAMAFGPPVAAAATRTDEPAVEDTTVERDGRRAPATVSRFSAGRQAGWRS
jgi:hypothetical protein